MFLSCDWGTSSFRLRLISESNLDCIQEIRTGEGVANVYPRWLDQKESKENRVGYYAEILKNHIATIESNQRLYLANVPVIISGMASSSIGMLDLPYKKLPFSFREIDLNVASIEATKDFEHGLVIVSGVSTEDDVMRGEETQLIGSAGEMGDIKALFIFPGTHSKHVIVENGYATGLKTFMTGEFFQLLSRESILSKSILSDAGINAGKNTAAFEMGVAESAGQNLLHHSFRVRTNDLFGRFSKNANFWYLSGSLIGSELQNLPFDNIGSLNLVSDNNLLSLYEMAIQILYPGMAVSSINIDAALVQGHASIYRKFK